MSSKEQMKARNEQYIQNKKLEIQLARTRETLEIQPTQLDRIEEQLNALTAESVTVEKLEAAIAEGVNEV